MAVVMAVAVAVAAGDKNSFSKTLIIYFQFIPHAINRADSDMLTAYRSQFFANILDVSINDPIKYFCD